MRDDVVKQLIELNAQFYEQVADQFARTRTRPQPGFYQLLDFLPAECRHFLDIGCGEGRLGRFLIARQRIIHYHGLDFSPALLNKAKAITVGQFWQRDINQPDCLMSLGSELTREIKLWREVSAVTVQLNLQSSTGATGAEATDFHVAASSVSGHTELCQGVHQALLRSLAQPPAAGGLQHWGPDASQNGLGCSQTVLQQQAPSLMPPLSSSTSSSASSALAGAMHIFMPVTVCCLRQLPVYVSHIYMCVCVCVYVSVSVI